MCKAVLLVLQLIVLQIQTVAGQAKQDTTVEFSVISSFPLQQVSPGDSHPVRISSTDKPLLLFIFLSPECPLSKNYTRTLNEFFRQYDTQVGFYGCISGSSFTLTEVNTFTKTYKVQFPMLLDSKKKLTNYIAATVTPEVFLLSRSGEIIYSGAIDDWVESLGKLRPTVSKHYLQDAIDASLSNKMVAVKRTTPFGCLINDY